jgi:hypothetical protein
LGFSINHNSRAATFETKTVQFLFQVPEREPHLLLKSPIYRTLYGIVSALLDFSIADQAMLELPRQNQAFAQRTVKRYDRRLKNQARIFNTTHQAVVKTCAKLQHRAAGRGQLAQAHGYGLANSIRTRRS